MQSRCAFIAFAVLMLVRAIPGQAQDDATDKAIRERADHDALKVSDYENLTVVVLSIESNSANITEDAVRTRTALRMTASGITPRSDANARFLYVFVHVDGGAFNIDLGFYRAASWKLPDGKIVENFLETWNSGHTLGTHGNSAAYIMKALDGRLDQFLNAYLKANQDAK